jgi:hypothetical protein
MNLDPRGFIVGLLRVLIPTPVQALLAGFIALAVVVFFDYPLIFARLGVSQVVLATAQNQSLKSVTDFLNTPLISDSSQIIYWIALVVFGYVLIWLAANGVVTSRTSVAAEMNTVDTAGWLPLMTEAGIKMAMGLVLVFYLVAFKLVFAYWMTLTAGAITNPGVLTILVGLGGLVGLTVQLYGVIVLIQLTIQPWYRTNLANL